MGWRSTNSGGFVPYAPILSVFALAWLGTVGLSVLLASYREQGVLRRMSTTLAPPAWLLGAELLVNLAVAVIALVIIDLGLLALGAARPQAPGSYVLSLALTAASSFAMGSWISDIARGGGVANGISQILIYPMMFFAR